MQHALAHILGTTILRVNQPAAFESMHLRIFHGLPRMRRFEQEESAFDGQPTVVRRSAVSHLVNKSPHYHCQSD